MSGPPLRTVSESVVLPALSSNYEDGNTEYLPAIEGFIILPADSTPEQEKRIRQEHDARNRAVAEMLKMKGFWIEGDEPGGVIINRY